MRNINKGTKFGPDRCLEKLIRREPTDQTLGETLPDQKPQRFTARENPSTAMGGNTSNELNVTLRRAPWPRQHLTPTDLGRKCKDKRGGNAP